VVSNMSMSHYFQMGPRAGLDAVKRRISCPCQEPNSDSSVTKPVAVAIPAEQSWVVSELNCCLSVVLDKGIWGKEET
jgi:hypothetical protein